MIFGKTKMELKVGIFVFIAIIILITAILSIGGFKTWTSRYKVNLVFNFVSGVKYGAPVRFAGVDIGEVKEINMAFNPQEQKTNIKVVCWIKNKVKIPVDSTVWVDTLGLLGEKYIEILPGKDYSKCLLPDGELTGVDPLPMHIILKSAEDAIKNLNDSIVKIKNKEGTVGMLLYDDKIYKELDALVTDLRKHPWKLFYKTK